MAESRSFFERVSVSMEFADKIVCKFQETPFSVKFIRIEDDNIHIERSAGGIVNLDFWDIKLEDILELNTDGLIVEIILKVGKITVYFNDKFQRDADRSRFIQILKQNLK